MDLLRKLDILAAPRLRRRAGLRGPPKSTPGQHPLALGLHAAFEHGSDWLSQHTAERWSREPDDVVIGQRVSSACYIVDAFSASLYLAWKYADDFEAGLVANTNLGGDNCRRGAVVDALLGGAAVGTGQIPARFCDGLHHASTRQQQIHRFSQ